MAMMAKNLLWSCAPIRCASLALVADAPLQTAAAVTTAFLFCAVLGSLARVEVTSCLLLNGSRDLLRETFVVVRCGR